MSDDTALFSVVGDVNTSAKELYDDLKNFHDWAFQWKMSFNPEPGKQAHEVILSCKSRRSSHPPLIFNNNNVSQTFCRKHLGVILDFKLTFEELNILPRATLITNYKALIRPYLDYGDALYVQAFK